MKQLKYSMSKAKRVCIEIVLSTLLATCGAAVVLMILLALKAVIGLF